MKATEQYFHAVLIFFGLHTQRKVVLSKFFFAKCMQETYIVKVTILQKKKGKMRWNSLALGESFGKGKKLMKFWRKPLFLVNTSKKTVAVARLATSIKKISFTFREPDIKPILSFSITKQPANALT